MKYNGTIENHYRRIDKHIGEIIKNADENTTIFIVSDHGFQASDPWFSFPWITFHDFEINYFLEKFGYLHYNLDGTINESLTLAEECEIDIDNDDVKDKKNCLF